MSDIYEHVQISLTKFKRKSISIYHIYVYIFYVLGIYILMLQFFSRNIHSGTTMLAKKLACACIYQVITYPRKGR